MGVGAVGVFSILLAVIPLWTFSQIRKGVFDSILTVLLGDRSIDEYRIVIGGIVGIVLVQLVLFLFVLYAFVLEKHPSAHGDEARKKDE
jgi:hypothetical protein|mmetsp:Transcript_7093/g.14151  ORF Transcript_7093/g.14151 Transcript_7093/m.14151 type:complete len:89 (+) Transcript_7093:22-288(+)